MKKNHNKLNTSKDESNMKKKANLPGYPLYPKSEDIYEKLQEETDINPEDISKTKTPNSSNALRKRKLDNEFTAKDLDIPGSELDDTQEAIGNEDEENNYYSLGGDDHNDLDED